MRFSRQEYWSGLPCPPPGDLSNPEIEPLSLMSPVLAGEFFTTSDTQGPHYVPGIVSVLYMNLLGSLQQTYKDIFTDKETEA